MRVKQKKKRKKTPTTQQCDGQYCERKAATSDKAEKTIVIETLVSLLHV